MNINDLPEEVIIKIFKYLDIETLIKSLSYVSKKFNQIVNSNHILWRYCNWTTEVNFDAASLSRLLSHAVAFRTFMLSEGGQGYTTEEADRLFNEHMRNAINLKWLSISGFGISRLTFIEPLKKLEVIQIDSCKGISQTELRVLGTLPNLHCLHAAFTNIDFETLLVIVKNCRKVHDIDVSGCKLTCNQIATIANHLSKNRVHATFRFCLADNEYMERYMTLKLLFNPKVSLTVHSAKFPGLLYNRYLNLKMNVSETSIAEKLNKNKNLDISVSNCDLALALEDYFNDIEDRNSDIDSDLEDNCDDSVSSNSDIEDDEDRDRSILDVGSGWTTTPSSESVLRNDDETEVQTFLQNGCGCSYGDSSEQCCRQFTLESLVENRLSCFEKDYYTEDHVNILNETLVTLINDLTHQSTNTCRSKKKNSIRQNTRASFLFQGRVVCLKTFCFAHSIGVKRYRRLKKRVNDGNISLKQHGNAGKTPKCKVMDKESVILVTKWLENYGEQHALVLPGRVPGYKSADVKLLPSCLSKKDIHRMYVDSVPDDMSTLSFTSFVRIWKATFPYLVIQRPRTDLCHVCQNNVTSLGKMAALPEEEKSRLLHESMNHLNHVQDERRFYKEIIINSKEVLKGHPVPTLQAHDPVSFDGEIHYSFDFAQQVHIPHSSQQPGPIYFLTPYKVGLFGVMCEAANKQVNFIIPEAAATGKGSNFIISMLHFYFENYGLGETSAVLHMDNCTGQNKNNHVIDYFLWRVANNLHQKVKLCCLPVGHTKFSPDWAFGILKSKFRKSEVHTLSDVEQCIKNSSPVSNVNIPQLVMTEEGRTVVPTFDWQKLFGDIGYKRVPNLRHFHYFVMCGPDEVLCKTSLKDTGSKFQLLRQAQIQVARSGQKPVVIEPSGLTLERRWYLFNKIRPFCKAESQDTLCPRPDADLPHPVRADRDENPPAPVELPAATRKRPTCSYCNQSGHRNVVVHGHIRCPKRKDDEGVHNG